jgi:hypothetical protein
MSGVRKRKRTLKTTKRVLKPDAEDDGEPSDVYAAHMVYRRQGRISETSSHFSASLQAQDPDTLTGAMGNEPTEADFAGNSDVFNDLTSHSVGEDVDEQAPLADEGSSSLNVRF